MNWLLSALSNAVTGSSRALPLMALLALTATTPGCVVALVGGAVAAAGGVAYARGELTAPLEAPLDRAWQGTLTAIEQLEFQVSETRKDGVYGTLEASTATDRRISIRLERMSANVTEVRIRVGVFGDEELSRYILQVIRENLAPTPEPSPSAEPPLDPPTDF